MHGRFSTVSIFQELVSIVTVLWSHLGIFTLGKFQLFFQYLLQVLNVQNVSIRVIFRYFVRNWNNYYPEFSLKFRVLRSASIVTIYAFHNQLDILSLLIKFPGLMQKGFWTTGWKLKFTVQILMTYPCFGFWIRFMIYQRRMILYSFIKSWTELVRTVILAC